MKNPVKNNTTNSVAITVRHLTVAYTKEPVLWDISVVIAQGLFLGVIGPNGAGKTTFLKALLNLIKPISGFIEILGKPYHKNRIKISYVPQRATVDWDFPINALDVVLMGRYKHIGWIKRPNTYDIDCAHEALAQVNLSAYAESPIGQLSGGQQQRVFLARALVQQAEIYMLDEPFIGVDMATEKIMIKLLKKLCDQGKTIILVHHDLQTLAEYFDWLLLLNKTCVAFGPVSKVLMPEYICAAYGDRNLFVYRDK